VASYNALERRHLHHHTGGEISLGEGCSTLRHGCRFCSQAKQTCNDGGELLQPADLIEHGSKFGLKGQRGEPDGQNGNVEARVVP
jgi:hypothetical protein